MKHRALVKAFLAAFALFCATNLLASAETDFELGVKAFKAGENESAVTYFESAKKQGMDTIALRYNLASSYYKVGRYEDAKELFIDLLKTDAMSDLAEFNLGLIAIKQKRWSTARDHFNAVVESGRDEKLTGLSEQQLARLTKEEGRFRVSLFGNVGYDDNIVSVSDDSAQNVADNFFDVFASANYLLGGKRDNGWIIDGSLYQINYRDYNEYDIGLYWAGLKKTFNVSGWKSGAHLKLYKSTYGGDDYLTSGMIDLTTRKRFSGTNAVHLRYRYEDINSDNPVYDYLAGWRQRASAEYRHYTRNSLAQLTYELELNNRGELIGPTYSYEYSPTRNTLRGKYTHKIKDWRLGGELAYRNSAFPTSPTVDRTDDQLSLALSADYYFDPTFKFTSKVQFIDNNSSEDKYVYDKSIIRIGLSKYF
jgi:tetratricopeptide (TPR) repeat protein